MDQGAADSLGKVPLQSHQPSILDHLSFRSGITDIPCPICGPNARAPSNKTRKVMRVWNNDGFITYNCARCGAQGCATGDKPLPATPIAKPDNSERMALAERLWGMSMPINRTAVATYLDRRRCYTQPHSIRYLPANGRHYPAMIAKFQGTSAVHLTRLRESGCQKAGTDHDKVMVGPCSGFPIVIRSTEWSRPLLICEGIEDALSLSLAFLNWTVWAAGSASMIHKLVPVPHHENIPTPKQAIVVVDYDMAGIKAAKRCLSINPQTRIIKFPKGLDPNAMLVNHSLNALRDFVTRHQPFHR